ncbi:MAG: ribonuclease HII [Anaerolineae bacterium]
MGDASLPSLDTELALRQAGHHLIAGIDEAGRGAMAGPVVAAAVILPLDRPDTLCQALAGLRDSKLLTPSQRDYYYNLIHSTALAVGIGAVPPQAIDTVGIAPAARLAMLGAISRLGHQPDHLLIDAFELPRPPAPQRAIIRGDRKCLSIAAASVIAKVTRDRIMVDLDTTYPGYGLAQHKGYVTQIHKLALYEHGPSPIHRMSYAPVQFATRENRRA